MILEILNQPTIQLLAIGITAYLLLSGIAKIIKNITLARRIEQNILNQIEDMLKPKMQSEKKK